jgi:predicted P-loop ATPase
MQFDRIIKISAAGSRKALLWPSQELLWSEFVARLATPFRSAETLQTYQFLSKSQRDELKDVGGFVGGVLKNNRRKAANVLGRDFVTLDLDRIPPGGVQDLIRRIRNLNCAFVLYSTRSHQEGAPRLRVILLLNHTVTADEYEPIARMLAQAIGIEYADPTTFEPSRLMYWPSICSDGIYVYDYADAGFVDADAILNLYADWRDPKNWPQVPGYQPVTAQQLTRQADPTGKPGLVGAFCRVYDIPGAIAEYIPGAYEPCDDDNRYTYTGGSTVGGAVLYQDKRFLYSHHATDPCSGKLVNAFDLIRLHRFGDLDDEAKPDTPANKLPSFTAMKKLALADQAVSTSLVLERTEEARRDFAGIAVPEITVPESAAPQLRLVPPAKEWVKQLTVDGNGHAQKTLQNIMLALQKHESLRGCVQLNLLSEQKLAAEGLPWIRAADSKLWRDEDTTEVCRWLETIFNKVSRADVRNALNAVAMRQAYHPIRDYLNGLTWDGAPRLDTLFIVYMGAEDTEYTRAVTRKSLVAAVARVMTPGCKYDYMPILIGGQGFKKSTVFFILAGGTEYFSDSLTTFEGQRAKEGVRGKWILEIAEMQTLERTEINAAKGFITQRSDYYRPAFGEETKDFLRQCVFFGTSNDFECLRDPTGGRRFWPIVIDPARASKDVNIDLPAERDQIWAEAVVRWAQGEPLYLTPELEAVAAAHQELHRESHPWEEPIRAYLDTLVPENWLDWDIETRRVFLCGNATGVFKLIPLPYVSVQEIYELVLYNQIRTWNLRDARIIGQILRRQPDWMYEGKQRHGAKRSLVKSFRRIAERGNNR